MTETTKSKLKDPELKSKWVAALRSGQYTQGKEALRTVENSYCCLGVLCDIMAPDAWKELSFGDATSWVWGKAEMSGVISTSVEQELGLDYRTSTDLLIDMNDDQNRSFNEIADWIEENL